MKYLVESYLIGIESATILRLRLLFARQNNGHSYLDIVFTTVIIAKILLYKIKNDAFNSNITFKTQIIIWYLCYIELLNFN